MDLDHVDALGAEDGVEGVGELGVPVADEEAERGGPVAQVREQVAGGLGGLGCGGVGGHPVQVHCASLDLHDGQDVEPAQSDGVEGEEVGGQQTCGLGTQEGSPVGVGLRWCRAEPAAVRIRRMVAVPRGARGRPVRLGGVGGPSRDSRVLGAALAHGSPR